MYASLTHVTAVFSGGILLVTAFHAVRCWLRREWGALITTWIAGLLVASVVGAPQRTASWLAGAMNFMTGTPETAQEQKQPLALPGPLVLPEPDRGNDIDIPWGTAAASGLAIVGLVIACGAVAAVRSRKQRRAEIRERRAGLEARHDVVRDAYAEFTTDILAVLDRPALADVTVAETERLINALDAARDARTYAARDYRAAVVELEIAWKGADSNARKLGTTRLPAPERRAVKQARLLLATALKEDGNGHERQLAYRRAMRLIEGIIDVPREAAAELANITRLSLQPSEGPQSVTLTKTKDPR